MRQPHSESKWYEYVSVPRCHFKGAYLQSSPPTTEYGRSAHQQQRYRDKSYEIEHGRRDPRRANPHDRRESLLRFYNGANHTRRVGECTEYEDDHERRKVRSTT